MKIYTIIGGVNGCGKSSLTGAMKAYCTDMGHIIDVDSLTAQYGDYLSAGRAAVERMDEYINRGISFTQETTLSGARTLRMVKKANEAGYRIRLHYIGLDTVEESKARIANRVRNGGHNIPDADVERRFEHRFDDLIKVLPYCDTAIFYDNYNGFVEVAGLSNGELVPKGDYRPKWFEEFAALWAEHQKI